ncbi:hypothetical protein L1887_15198 [Cichorium endivia]|nr:hypothetical protein L1887_15198 [Cichorium endivia]
MNRLRVSMHIDSRLEVADEDEEEDVALANNGVSRGIARRYGLGSLYSMMKLCLKVKAFPFHQQITDGFEDLWLFFFGICGWSLSKGEKAFLYHT